MDDLDANRRAELEALVRLRIGLNPQSVHPGHLDTAVRERMAACAVPNLSLYLAWLQSHPDELAELTERLVVVESWFFRDVQPFRFLEHFVTGEWNARHSGRPLQLLSVPCGNGEEPFSMAMTLLNTGLDAGRFRVDGVDISQRALRQAREGCYGESSFREREEPVADFRARFFHNVGTRLTVNDEVRATVQFRQGNLVDRAFLSDAGGYDVIFCRNLLIYLDAEGRRAALGNLQRLLNKDGVLYVGHVEGGSLRGERLDVYDAAYPFAFRTRREPGPADVAEAIAEHRPCPEACGVSNAADGVPEQTSAAMTDPHADFEAARTLADGGRLDEAAQQCLKLLAKSPPSAAVFCLLGVIRQAQGDAAEAEKCYHKALYLDPRHHEALVHLAMLASRRGAESAALNYRRRAAKLKREE